MIIKIPLITKHIIDISNDSHCVKSICIRSYSGPYFPVSSPNAGKCGPE